MRLTFIYFGIRGSSGYYSKSITSCLFMVLTLKREVFKKYYLTLAMLFNHAMPVYT